MIWPSRIQNRVQAMFDADEGKAWVDFPQFTPKNSNGDLANFCGECGKVGPTDPDNDVCTACARSLTERAPK